MTAIRDEDVRRLDVSVDDAPGVGRIERLGDLRAEFDDQAGVQRPARQAMLQRLPLQEFHGDEGLAVVLADFVDRANVRVVQRRCGASLTQKPLKSQLFARNAFRKELQRDGPPERGVLGTVYDSHPTAAQSCGDSVVRHALPKEGIGDHRCASS